MEVQTRSQLDLFAVLDFDKTQKGRTKTSFISSELGTITPLHCDTPKLIQTMQCALLVTEGGKYELTDSFPVPDILANGEVMIQTYAVGLNPIDWKSVEYNFCLPEHPWITGREMAGVISRVAPDVKNVRPGDRVWTSE
jgi:Zn-dependent alcohol dehydrogenase